MPDLGKYAEAVLSAYAVSIVLIVLLVLVSLASAEKTNAVLIMCFIVQRSYPRRCDHCSTCSATRTGEVPP